jgi:hypothetical protein
VFCALPLMINFYCWLCVCVSINVMFFFLSPPPPILVHFTQHLWKTGKPLFRAPSEKIILFLKILLLIFPSGKIISFSLFNFL